MIAAMTAIKYGMDIRIIVPNGSRGCIIIAIPGSVWVPIDCSAIYLPIIKAEAK
jgi:hypothetical protein